MNGVVIVDKPTGPTSRDVVEKVKRILGVRKAGHTGTLDPLATGVLPVCLNEATKLVQFMALDDKQYRATLLLGVRTDTLDTDGEVIERRTPEVTEAQVEEALLGLVGKRQQTPPLYSAVKYRGRPLYDWTRRGIAVEQTPREVEIYGIGIEQVRLPEVTFTVSCSKGTYIRSLCAEVGEQLGCGGCLAALRRTRSGSFGEGEAVALGDGPVEQMRERLLAGLKPLQDLLPSLVEIAVEPALAQRLRNGYQPSGEDLLPYHIPFLAEGDMVTFTHARRLVAVARMLRAAEGLPAGGGERQAVRILRVMNDDSEG